MKVALIQMIIIDGNIKLNIEKARALIKKAATLNVQAVALPELWTTGYDLKNIKALASSSENLGALSMLVDLARTYNMYIFGGSIATKVDKILYNRAYVIDTDGEIIATYDKLHLIPLFNEDLYFSQGNKICSIPFFNTKCGIQICYDLRFPEIARLLTIKEGCKILFIHAAWPTARGEHWIVLNRARAIENQLFICATNRVGSNENIDFFGHSLIIDPLGNIIAEGSGSCEEIVVGDIDLNNVDEVRENIPALMNRRKDIY